MRLRAAWAAWAAWTTSPADQRQKRAGRPSGRPASFGVGAPRPARACSVVDRSRRRPRRPKGEGGEGAATRVLVLVLDLPRVFPVEDEDEDRSLRSLRTRTIRTFGVAGRGGTRADALPRRRRPGVRRLGAALSAAACRGECSAAGSRFRCPVHVGVARTPCGVRRQSVAATALSTPPAERSARPMGDSAGCGKAASPGFALCRRTPYHVTHQISVRAPALYSPLSTLEAQ